MIGVTLRYPLGRAPRRGHRLGGWGSPADRWRM